MKISLHTGFRSAQKAVAQRPTAPMAKPAKPVGKSALRNHMPSLAPKKTGIPFGGKAAPLFGAKAKAI